MGPNKKPTIKMDVNYIDLLPAEYLIWRHNLFELYDYVESIELEDDKPVKEGGAENVSALTFNIQI